MRSRQASIVGQLAAYDSLGYVRWQNGSAGRWLVTPVGGNEMNLSTREVELFLSGLSTGAQGRRKPSGQLTPEELAQAVAPSPPMSAELFEAKLRQVEQVFARYKSPQTGEALPPIMDAMARLKTLRQELMRHQDLFPVDDPVRQRVRAAVNVGRWLLGIPQ